MALFNQLAASPELSLRMILQPGDVQLLSNHTCLHYRGSFRCAVALPLVALHALPAVRAVRTARVSRLVHAWLPCTAVYSPLVTCQLGAQSTAQRYARKSLCSAARRRVPVLPDTSARQPVCVSSLTPCLHAPFPFATRRDSPERTRHLLRLWLSPPADRPLPACYAEIMGGSTVPGMRGGIFIQGAQPHIPLEAE